MKYAYTQTRLTTVRNRYDDLALCLTNVRSISRAIDIRDRLEETQAIGRKAKTFRQFGEFFKTAKRILAIA